MKLKRKNLKLEEMLKIDNLNYEVKLSDYQIALAKNKAHILGLEIEKINLGIKELLQVKSNKINNVKTYTDSLKKLCGIKEEKWGFDPDSGEIKV